MHIALEVVFRVDMAEESRLLTVKELSLRVFLKDQIISLQTALGTLEVDIQAPLVSNVLCVVKPVVPSVTA